MNEWINYNFLTVSTRWNHQNIQHPKWRQIFWQPWSEFVRTPTHPPYLMRVLFNDVRFLSDSGFLFSSKKTLCWGHPNILLHWIYIKKHMVAYENNKYYGMMYIFVSHALFLRPLLRPYWPVWKCACMLWKWQHRYCNLAEMAGS